MTSKVSPPSRTSVVKCSTQKCRINSSSRAAPVMRCRYQLIAREFIFSYRLSVVGYHQLFLKLSVFSLVALATA